MANYVAYVRVSTDRQGKSGLGLEAQEALIASFIASTAGAKLLCPVFTEIETGKNDDRPVLAQAISRCHQTGATLLISKLDRLARSVSFISNLMKAVDFRVAEMPHATPFELHIRASVAEEEARMISARTKAGLAAAKARGTWISKAGNVTTGLGGDRGYRAGPDKLREMGQLGGIAATVVNVRRANRYASEISPTLAELRAEGITSNKAVAAALNARGVATPRGGHWTGTAVRRLLKRVEALA